MSRAKRASVDEGEVLRFSQQTQDWWNPEGAWKPLHKLNPARIQYIRSAICKHFSATDAGKAPLQTLSVLDIGCGGGLLCEPLARLGAKVTGLDASAKALEVARNHAVEQKLKIAYIDGSVETLKSKAQAFDVILAMEILEHVADIGSFLSDASALLKPNGLMIFSTVNRTMKSFLFGVVVAEHVMGWVPKGMHDWNKFVRPSELAAHLTRADLALSDLMGVVYKPLEDTFKLCPGKMQINYLASAVKRS